MPKISVIIPIYNVEKYLRRCLDSVLNQTFTDWQAICVNDGSPDNCADILDEYAKKDSRFIVVNKKNGGLSDARNVGMEHATGDYILYLDSDDFIHPQTMEIAY
ncbi:MAG: glycosyltransferase family 2 protein, partial [Alphaproteobacteria bacterium]|nr:glycosyltransferase family 2 protein [Alphaproteobacteria bacterium]